MAQFVAASDRYLADRAAMHARVGARITAELHPEFDSRSVVVPVVLEPAADVLGDVPVVACGRALTAALAAGWDARVTRAVAAVPRTGLLTTYALRARRHDERLWACWWNGAFEAAQYFRAGSQVEALGGQRMAAMVSAAVPVEGMSLAQIKSLAAERGIKIPSKFKKDQVVAHVRAAGLVFAPAPPPRRGVLDALEGLHLARHLVGAS